MHSHDVAKFFCNYSRTLGMNPANLLREIAVNIPLHVIP